MSARRLVALALSAGMLSAPASAQVLSAEMRRLGLVDADWKAMMAAARTLYDPQIAEEGAMAEWTSDTGSAGLVTLDAVTEGEAGRPCVTLAHAVTPAKADPTSFRSRRCQSATGGWPVAVE